MSFGTETCIHADSNLGTDESLRKPLEVTNPPPAASASTTSTVLDVVKLMRKSGSPAVLLCDPEDGALRGIFTERDLLRIAHLDPDFVWMPIKNYMTPNPVTLGPWDSIGFALNCMTAQGFRHLPIVDTSGRVCGLVSRSHLLKHLSRNLGPKVETAWADNANRLRTKSESEMFKMAS